jgi:two-component system LytT family response regulator
LIRALVVDDEPLVRERLCALLTAHADVQVVGERGDGPSALEAFRELAPHVVFLDIQMPGLSGLEVAETWRSEGALPVIVFVTAFDQFAVEAFRLHALDYLTKPIDPERFSESLDRVRECLKPQNRGDLDQRLQAMLELHERRQAVRPHLVVREHDRYILVPTAGIHALEATGNYVSLHCERASYILRSSLSATEGRLDPRRFLRTHRSWIVNLDHVREAQTLSKGAWILLTRSGMKVPVGQQYREALLKILG